DLPATALVGVTHERTALPSTCTVQAPHWAIPQPNLVPVRPISSRMTQSSGASSGLLVVTCRPLILNVVIAASPRSLRGSDAFCPRAATLICGQAGSNECGAGTPSGANDGT